MLEDDITLENLRSALSHLDDPSYLEGHPLADACNLTNGRIGISRGQELRRLLRLAIESLDPGPQVPPNSPEGRPYHILSRRYAFKESMTAIAADLDISERQAYRELHSAVEALARILDSLDQHPATGYDSEADGSRGSTQVREELERLSADDYQEVDIGQLVAQVVLNADRLAREKGIKLRFSSEARELRVTTHRVVLRQAILNFLSHVVRVHRGDCVAIHLGQDGQYAILRCTYTPQAGYDPISPEQPGGMAQQLFASLGIQLTRQIASDGSILVTAHLPTRQDRTLLVIDDNQGFIALVRRYLHNYPYHVHGASEFDEGLEMLAQLRPDVVLLDVMMPKRDGWELLQAIRTSPEGRHARVVVCSIINDPELASALGADGFLHKPINRSGLLRVLQGTPPSA